MNKKIDETKVLHCVKRLVKIEELFNAEVERLLEDLGITREEVHRGSFLKKADT